MKTICRAIIFFFLFVGTWNHGFSQDCNIDDPLMDDDFYSALTQGCYSTDNEGDCMIPIHESRVFYDLEAAHEYFEANCFNCSSNNPYQVDFGPIVTVPINTPYCSFVELANNLNALVDDEDIVFHDHPDGIYVLDPPNLNLFGIMAISAGDCWQTIEPEFTGSTTYIDCSDIEIPELDPSQLGENAPTPEDMIIFDIPNESNDFTTDDIVNASGFDEENYTGPSANAVGTILNSVLSTGILQAGAGCININCFDLSELAEQLNEGDLANSINLEMDELAMDDDELELPNEYGSWSEMIMHEVEAELATINLAQLLNESFGMSIPEDLPCDQTIPLPGFAGGEEPNSSEEIINSLTLPPPSPSTDADLDFFNQGVPGLGIDGPGAATPSPSALNMIEAINGGVNLYNGSQSTSIPLHTVQSNDISVPISIYSSNNGLKVNEMGSLLGQNWDLNVGGMISRVVKGLPDEYDGTITSEGRGIIYRPTLLFEFPSNVGLDVIIGGAEDIGCSPSTTVEGLERRIKYGFQQTIYEGAKVKIEASWTPLQGNKIDINLKVSVFEFPPLVPAIEVFLQAGFSIGINASQKIGDIEYEERGLGFMHLNNADRMDDFGLEPLNSATLNNLSQDEAGKYLNIKHSTKNYEDQAFFNDQIANWDRWIEAFGGNHRFNSTTLDTEPDEFYFNVGGYSGKFSYNLEGDYVIFPHQEGILITRTLHPSTGDIVSFVIKTPDGKEYWCGAEDINVLNPEGVDFTQNTNYYLPNFYTYPEIGTDRDEFGKAEIDEGFLSYFSFFGFRKIVTYGNTYDRNYKKSPAPRFSSSWHLTKVKSLLTQEEVNFNYTENGNLTYYSDKSFTHSFPNFDVHPNGNLKTTENLHLNPRLINPTPSKWENGKAQLAYSVTETELRRWTLSDIETNRGETVRFEYDIPREELANDFLLSRILVNRDNGNALFKGWEFSYKTEDTPGGGTSECLEISNETQGVQTVMPGDTKFSLGVKHNPNHKEYNNYFHLFFSLECIVVPFRLDFSYGAQTQNQGHTNELAEFGSLMDVKRRLHEFDKSKEEAIYNAELRRSFLISIKEIDKNNVLHNDFVTDIHYVPGVLPKRFSMDQDLMGYYNSNTSGSPLPPISYIAIGNAGSTITPSTPGIEKHFGFYNVDFPNSMHAGQTYAPDALKVKIGALSSIGYKSGGRIAYTYEPNQMQFQGNTILGAGIRVSTLTETPGSNMTAKKTNYSYLSEPHVINDPVRISMNLFDRYYPLLEKKVVCSSAPMNPMFANKNNHAGYSIVKEAFIGNGSILHYFTHPGDFDTRIGSSQNIINNDRFEHNRTGLNPQNETYNKSNDDLNMPPSLTFPEDMVHINEFMGLEYKTQVFNSANFKIQQSDKDFEYYGTRCDCVPSDFNGGNSSANQSLPPGCDPSLVYFKSERYQHNFHGTFLQNYFHRQIKHYLPYFKDIDDLNPLFEALINLISNGAFFPGGHPYKYVDRTTFVSQRCVRSGNIRLNNSSVVNYFEDNSGNYVETEYIYDSNGYKLSSIPLETITETSDNHIIHQFNFFSTDVGSDPALDYFDPAALSHLNNALYKMPLYSKTFQDQVLVAYDVTPLTVNSDRVVPKSNYSLRNGELALTGVFQGYEPSSGKPLNYYLAKQGTTEANAPGDLTKFFSPITFSWTNQLQLASRTYNSFQTSYTYDGTYYMLESTTDPDGIVSNFSYDSKWRLFESLSLNGKQQTRYDYNIGSGNNFVQSSLSFDDGEYPDQQITQYFDGFGKPIETRRDNDGAVLGFTVYDEMFRASSVYAIGQGASTITYDNAPIVREQTIKDALGNETITINSGDGTYFSKSEVIDANQHTLTTYADGLGRTLKRISAEGGETIYSYDALNRLTGILNPENESYSYTYSNVSAASGGFGQLSSKVVPGAQASTYWWDKSFRPVAVRDGVGNTQIMKYDGYNRITQVYEATAGANLGDENIAVEEDAFDGYLGQLLVSNTYEGGHTWLSSVEETVMNSTGFGGSKNTIYTRDDIGRPENISMVYPDGELFSTFTNTDAGLITKVVSNMTGGNANIDYTTHHRFDDLLRPSQLSIEFDGGGLNVLNQLFYNPYDQVFKKYVGVTNDTPLQKVDYRYDAIGRLTHINSPAEMECFEGMELCDMKARIKIYSDDPSSCRYLSGIEINGTMYNLQSALDLYNSPNQLLTELEAALDALGLFGEVAINVYDNEMGVIIIEIIVTGTNATEISLIYQNCNTPTDLDLLSCCVNGPPAPGNSDNLSPDYVDLYYQAIEYDGLDISRIEIGSDCTTGMLRNDYTYDGDHRITSMNNVLFPKSGDPIADAYSTQYTYHPAGSIETLNRNGLINIGFAGPEYGQIDLLTYTYASNRLASVIDGVQNPIAQPKGFVPQASNYVYDQNGNVIQDGGKGLNIEYNLLNLPKLVAKTQGADQSSYDYTFGGEKIKQTSTVDGVTAERFYLGGFEFVDGEAQFYRHGEGRIVLENNTFEYQLSDHLGNAVVLFEDKDLDGVISTDIPANPEDAEVIQRNFYYPFGLALQGTWDDVATPKQNYLYNGKELDRGLGLNWHAYGFRMYDAAIGRFPSVDPIADQFSWVSPYNYAENDPIGKIDLWGLQGTIPIPWEIIISLPKFPPPPTIPIPPIAPPYIPQNPTFPESGNMNKPVDSPIDYMNDIDWENNPPATPEDLGNDWEEVTHPDNKSGKREFENNETKEKIRFDPGEPGKPGNRGKDHWHRHNPSWEKSQGKKDFYLDKFGKPTNKGSGPSHIVPSGYPLPPVSVTPDSSRKWKKYEKDMKKYEKQLKKYKKKLKKFYKKNPHLHV